MTYKKLMLTKKPEFLLFISDTIKQLNIIKNSDIKYSIDKNDYLVNTHNRKYKYIHNYVIDLFVFAINRNIENRELVEKVDTLRKSFVKQLKFQFDFDNNMKIWG